MYNKLKDSARMSVLKGGEVNETLLTEFSALWSKLIKSHINKMSVPEARIACKVVLKSIGVDPDIIGDPKNQTEAGRYQ